MTAKEYLKQAYLLDKQIQVDVKELEQLREMRGTIQGCTYGEKIGTNPNRNLEAPFIKTIEKIWEYEQKIDAQGKEPTMQDMDALALYLNEYADGGNPFTVSLMKYCAKMRRMTGYAEYLSDAAKDEFNRYGLVKTYDGVAITGISSAKKLGDGSLLIPDKRIYGIAGKIGRLDMKGETHTYEDHDNNNEKIHLMVKDFTFGYSIDHIERVAKIVLQ